MTLDHAGCHASSAVGSSASEKEQHALRLVRHSHGVPRNRSGAQPVAQLRCAGPYQWKSERLIVSHHENNYGGAVKRLNLIEEKLAELDYGSAPVFLINGPSSRA